MLVHPFPNRFTLNASAFMNTETDKLGELKAIYARLDALEKQIMDELAEDPRKEQPDSFDPLIDELKNQLENLNLVKNLDNILEDHSESG